MKSSARGLLLATGLVLAGVPGVLAQEDGRPASHPLPTAEDPAAKVIERVVLDTRHPSLRWSHFPHYEDELRGIYQGRSWRPLWTEYGRLRPAADEALRILSTAGERGLDPEDYDVSYLRAQMDAFQRGTLSAPEAALLDAGLSIAMLRHLSDLHIGRVNPANLHFGFNIESKKLHLASVLTAAVLEDRIGETIREVEPRFRPYRDLKDALARYRSLASTGEVFAVEEGQPTIHPDDAWDGAPELARYLRLLGDLPPSSSAGGSGTLDPELASAVRAFQERHGLEPDGVLGPATFAALRVPLATRVRQIELALERMRWLPEPTGRRFVVANIPAFEVWGFESADAPPSLAMRVVVGRSLRTETPAFMEEMEYVVFSPYWNVPWSITMNEMLPRMKSEPDYLTSRNLEVVPAGQAPAGPGDQAIDAEMLEGVASGALRIRQRPGPTNSLGPAKFIFPNANNVYLHGTPATQLFARSRRDFSHGCVRLESPQLMAEWVLGDRPEWTAERIADAMAAGTEERVDLERPIPVLLFYATAMVDPEDGRVRFFEDIYEHDQTLERALAGGYPYAP